MSAHYNVRITFTTERIYPPEPPEDHCVYLTVDATGRTPCAAIAQAVLDSDIWAHLQDCNVQIRDVFATTADRSGSKRGQCHE